MLLTSLLAGLRLLSRFAWTPTSLCKALHVNLRRQGCEAGLSARWLERGLQWISLASFRVLTGSESCRSRDYARRLSRGVGCGAEVFGV